MSIGYTACRTESSASVSRGRGPSRPGQGTRQHGSRREASHHCGCSPPRVLADTIYRNRETIAWCKDRGIQLTGPALGRPPKDPEVTKTAHRQAYQDICDRNMAHLRETSFCVIDVALLCINLTKRLRSLGHDFFASLMRILCSMDRLSAIA